MQAILKIPSHRVVQIISLVLLILLSSEGYATTSDRISPQIASATTQAANVAVQQALPFDDKNDGSLCVSGAYSLRP